MPPSIFTYCDSNHPTSLTTTNLPNIFSPIQTDRSSMSSTFQLDNKPCKADLRIQKDLHELSLHRISADSADFRVSFPLGHNYSNYTNKSSSVAHPYNNIRVFHVSIYPREGVYSASEIEFEFKIPSTYPFTAPKLRCLTRVLHPAINFRSGEVYLSILKNEWDPVLNVNHVIFALQLLFLECNVDDYNAPINKEVVNLIQKSRNLFEQLVKQTLQGGFFFGLHWPRNQIQTSLEESDYYGSQENEALSSAMKNSGLGIVKRASTPNSINSSATTSYLAESDSPSTASTEINNNDEANSLAALSAIQIQVLSEFTDDSAQLVFDSMSCSNSIVTRHSSSYSAATNFPNNKSFSANCPIKRHFENKLALNNQPSASSLDQQRKKQRQTLVAARRKRLHEENSPSISNIQRKSSIGRTNEEKVEAKVSRNQLEQKPHHIVVTYSDVSLANAVSPKPSKRILLHQGTLNDQHDFTSLNDDFSAASIHPRSKNNTKTFNFDSTFSCFSNAITSEFHPFGDEAMLDNPLLLSQHNFPCFVARIA
jgi:ubiquitin-conjugating enzyme E2 M